MFTFIHYTKIGSSAIYHESVMVLDSKFRKLLERELNKSLEVISKENIDFKQIWKCVHADDFLYGWHMGRVDDFCRNQFFLHYHKAPEKEDLKEIQEIMFRHAKDFREQLKNSKFDYFLGPS